MEHTGTSLQKYFKNVKRTLWNVGEIIKIIRENKELFYGYFLKITGKHQTNITVLMQKSGVTVKIINLKNSRQKYLTNKPILHLSSCLVE